MFLSFPAGFSSLPPSSPAGIPGEQIFHSEGRKDEEEEEGNIQHFYGGVGPSHLFFRERKKKCCRVFIGLILPAIKDTFTVFFFVLLFRKIFACLLGKKIGIWWPICVRSTIRSHERFVTKRDIKNSILLGRWRTEDKFSF